MREANFFITLEQAYFGATVTPRKRRCNGKLDPRAPKARVFPVQKPFLPISCCDIETSAGLRLVVVATCFSLSWLRTSILLSRSTRSDTDGMNNGVSSINEREYALITAAIACLCLFGALVRGQRSDEYHDRSTAARSTVKRRLEHSRQRGFELRARKGDRVGGHETEQFDVQHLTYWSRGQPCPDGRARVFGWPAQGVQGLTVRPWMCREHCEVQTTCLRPTSDFECLGALEATVARPSCALRQLSDDDPTGCLLTAGIELSWGKRWSWPPGAISLSRPSGSATTTAGTVAEVSGGRFAGQKTL